uniref:Uncharacterized protein n=1 Tax=Leersia perrieri TaxID=77586 RepID=A0A0D9W7G3_9ORYZ
MPKHMDRVDPVFIVQDPITKQKSQSQTPLSAEDEASNQKAGMKEEGDRTTQEDIRLGLRLASYQVEEEEMGGFDLQVKERAKELKLLKGAMMKGVKVVSDSCKKAWKKVKNIKR